MKIVCVGYRKWALNIYKRLKNSLKEKIIIIDSKKKYDEDMIIKLNPDLILFYGWSWIISKNIIKNKKCLMLHPSPLPKYRGGSPLQNQIIDGKIHSAVTIFKMVEEVDAGDIYGQKYLSLDGSLDDIFKRIENIGYDLSLDIINSNPKPIIQNHNEATYYKRRKPEDSEITINELKSKNSKYLINKIRMLSDPYPNAFIKTIDGKKLFIKIASLE